MTLFKKNIKVLLLIVALVIFSVTFMQIKNVQAESCNCSSVPSATFEITDEPEDVAVCGQETSMVVKLHTICNECLTVAQAKITDSSNGTNLSVYVDRETSWPVEVEAYWSGGKSHGVRLYSFTQQIDGPTTMWAQAEFIRNGCHCCAAPGDESNCSDWVRSRSDITNGAYCYANVDIGTVSKAVTCSSDFTVEIATPDSGSTFQEGAVVNFTGVLNSPVGDIDYYQWCRGDCTDGGTQIGTTLDVNVSNLPIGTHQIYFRAYDDNGWSDQANIPITIVPATLSAVIDAPVNGSVFQSRGVITFTGHGEDASGDIDHYQWCRGDCTDGGSQFGVVATLGISWLPVGSHQIYFRVHDDTGWSDPDIISITILPPGLEAVIDSPSNNAIFDDGDVISLSGHGENPSGVIDYYQWCRGKCSEGGVQIGTTTSFNVTLPNYRFVNGLNQVYFRVYDDNGWSDRDDVVNITVGDSAVDLKLDDGGTPSDGPVTVIAGNSLNFSWTGTNVNPDSCSSSGGDWVNSNLPASGSSVGSAPVSEAPVIYSITCTIPGGGVVSDSVRADVVCNLWESNWGGCSDSCGGGIQTKTTTEADCSTSTETRECNEFPCSCIDASNFRETIL